MEAWAGVRVEVQETANVLLLLVKVSLASLSLPIGGKKLGKCMG